MGGGVSRNPQDRPAILQHHAWILGGIGAAARPLGLAIAGCAARGFEPVFGECRELGLGRSRLAEFYRMACNTMWPLFMLYFGLYFPEPFPDGQARWYVRFATRVSTLAVIVSAIGDIILRIGEIEHFAPGALWSD
jgi:hypothetical protein